MIRFSNYKVQVRRVESSKCSGIGFKFRIMFKAEDVVLQVYLRGSNSGLRYRSRHNHLYKCN